MKCFFSLRYPNIFLTYCLYGYFFKVVEEKWRSILFIMIGFCGNFLENPRKKSSEMRQIIWVCAFRYWRSLQNLLGSLINSIEAIGMISILFFLIRIYLSFWGFRFFPDQEFFTRTLSKTRKFPEIRFCYRYYEKIRSSTFFFKVLFNSYGRISC